MSLPIDATCMMCYLGKQLALARSLGDDATANAYMRELTQHFLDLPQHLPSPMLAPGTTALLKKYYGLEEDRFKAEKQAANEFVVARLAEIRRRVRGGICSNDATREDAAVVGLDFPIIDNGSKIAGTLPEILGEEAKNAMETADVILSKGMANTETLYGSGYNIYYVFLVKCDKFMRIFQKDLMTPMFIGERK